MEKYHCTAILFLFIFSYVPALAVQPRSVNLALETSFLFDPQDIKENATFLQNLQNAIDKLKSILNQNVPIFRQQHKDDVLLTKFLTEVGKTLIKFDDTDTKKFANDLSEAILIEADKNKVFDDMVEDNEMKMFIQNTIKEWANTDPMTLKVELAKYVINDDNSSITSFFSVLNKFFDEKDEEKFQKLLKKFKKAMKNKQFSNFLSKTLDFVVFQRYNKLDFLLKQIWKQELKKFTDFIRIQRKDLKQDDTTVNYRRLSLSNIARAETFSESSRESFDVSDSIEHSKTKEPIKTNSENEIIIKKDLQMNVRKDGNMI